MNPYDTKLTKLERQMYDIITQMLEESDGNGSCLSDGLIDSARAILDEADEQVMSALDKDEIEQTRKMCLDK